MAASTSGTDWFTVSTMPIERPCATRRQAHCRKTSGPAHTVSCGTRPTLRSRSWGSTWTRLDSVIGVSGWCRMELSPSGVSPTKDGPGTRCVRWGNAGVTGTNAAPSQLARASATGPDVPAGVRSKVEQILAEASRALCPQPLRRIQRGPEIAWSTGDVRLERDHDRVDAIDGLVWDADALDDACRGLDQVVGQVGGTCEIVGDAAKNEGSLMVTWTKG